MPKPIEEQVLAVKRARLLTAAEPPFRALADAESSLRWLAANANWIRRSAEALRDPAAQAILAAFPDATIAIARPTQSPDA